jgi:hypothetical protein
MASFRRRGGALADERHGDRHRWHPRRGPTDWTIVEVGDVNGDGKADIGMAPPPGAVAVCLMNGDAVASVELVGGAPPS